MRTSRRVMALLRALTVMVLLTAFGGGPASAATMPSRQAAAESPIKVGVIGAFTGGSADMGMAMRNGVLLAFEEINAAGGINGRKLEMVAYDDEADPSKATTGARRLIERDQVVAVIGNPNTGTAIATVNVTRAAKVPQVIPIAQSPEVMGDPPSEWAFRITPTNPMDIERLLEYAKSKGWTQLGLLHDTSPYGLSGKVHIEKAAPQFGIKIVGTESYTVGAPDLTPQALNLRKAGAGVVLMWSLGADAGRFVKNVRAIGWNVPLMGGRGLAFAIFAKIAGADGEGTIATGAFDPDKPEARDFMRRYENRFKTTESIDFAALGYDAARLLAESLKRAGSDDREAIKIALESIDKFTTVYGPPNHFVSFGPDKHEGAQGSSSVVLLEMKNSVWVPLRN